MNEARTITSFPVVLASKNAEMSVLGSFLQDEVCCKYIMSLSRTDFYFPEFGEIFVAMSDVYASNKPIDLITVSEELTRKGTLEGVGGVPVLLQCSRFTPTTVNFKSYYDIVMEFSKKRQIYSLLQRSQERILVGMDDVDSIVQDTVSLLRSIGKSEGGWISIGEMAMNVINDLETGANSEKRYLLSGFPDLDKKIGFYPGELTIIGARPAVGKSAMLSTIAYNLACRGKKVGVCSLEMMPEQYIKRLLSFDAKVDGQKLRFSTQLTGDEWGNLWGSIERMSRMFMKFTFSVRTIEELRAHAQQLKDTEGLDMLAVDYLQLLQTKSTPESNYVRISQVSTGLKALALDLGIPVIAAAQVGRPKDKGVVRKPTLDSLRGSGEIEQDADCVIMLHDVTSENDIDLPAARREEAANTLAMGNQYLYASVEKNRNGATGDSAFVFIPSKMIMNNIYARE